MVSELIDIAGGIDVFRERATGKSAQASLYRRRKSLSVPRTSCWRLGVANLSIMTASSTGQA